MATVFSHSGDIGDLLAALPVVEQLGGGELVLFPAPYTGWRMTRDRAENLRSFLELQPYIAGVRWDASPRGTNLDDWRLRYVGHRNLTDMVAEAFGQPHPDRERPWLRVDKPNRVARILFARSLRYQNDQVDWHRIYNEYASEAMFVGFPEEHKDFERTVGPIGYVETCTYLDLARMVAGADLVVVNQTSIRWLAEGYKIPVIVEVEPNINNTHWQRRAAHYLYGPADIPRLSDVENLAIESVIQRARGRSVITDDRLRTIARLVRSIRHLPGDLAEFGCFRGGSAAVISGCCGEKRLHLFDTWEGHPDDDQLQGGHRKGEFSADFDDVRRFLYLNNVQYFRGIFPGSAPTSAGDDSSYAFVHLDADTYQSTRAGLEYFVPRLVAGGVCVLDDYEWGPCPGVKLAVHELCPNAYLHVGPQQAWFRT